MLAATAFNLAAAIYTLPFGVEGTAVNSTHVIGAGQSPAIAVELATGNQTYLWGSHGSTIDAGQWNDVYTMYLDNGGALRGINNTNGNQFGRTYDVYDAFGVSGVIWVEGTPYAIVAGQSSGVRALNLLTGTQTPLPGDYDLVGARGLDAFMRPGGSRLQHIAIGIQRGDTDPQLDIYAGGVLVRTFNNNNLLLSQYGSPRDVSFQPSAGRIWIGVYGDFDEGYIYDRPFDFQAYALDPAIYEDPADVVVTPGGEATLTVVATGTTPFSYQWRKADLALPGATAASLTFTNAQAGDAGAYSVVVTNPVGSQTSRVARVFVGYAPGIASPPASQHLLVGETASFSVTVTGTPPIRLQWFQNGVALADATNATLTLTNAQPFHAGNYSVQAASDYGAVTSSPAVLSLTGFAPVIVQGPQPLTVLAGDTAVFSVVVTGSPPIRLQWLKDLAPVAGATNATLTLTNVQLAQAGYYQVRATNALGAVTSSNAVLSLLDGVLDLAGGLLAYYPLEGGFSDLSGHGNHASALGAPQFTNGPLTRAVWLDGSSDYFTCPVNLNLFTNVTISFWVNLRQWPGNRYQLVSNDSGSWGRVVAVISSGVAQIWHTAGGSASTVAGLPTNEWLHVVGVWSATSTLLYVNGGPVAVGPGSTAALDDAPVVTVGAGAYSDKTAGMFDELRIYGRAFSSGEVAALYTWESTPSVRAGHAGGRLQVWWKGTGLERSADLSTWEWLTNATQPHVVPMTNAVEFFRVRP